MHIIQYSEFEAILNSLCLSNARFPIAVAVSGGADSLCLAFLCKQWAQQHDVEMIALIVDHKIRAESAQEASFVSNLLNNFKINTAILVLGDICWNTGIQDKARDLRNTVLLNYCCAYNIPYLIIGHHLDDQLETILMRQQMGANIIGEAGISAKIITKKAIILRPFLGFSRNIIRNTLSGISQFWIEDPSNSNMKYKRTQIRHILNSSTSMQKQEMMSKMLVMQDRRIRYEKFILDFLRKYVSFNQFGLAKIDLEAFINSDLDMSVLILKSLVTSCTGKSYFIKLKKVYNVVNGIKEQRGKVWSLGYANIKVRKIRAKKMIIIFRSSFLLPKLTRAADLNGLWDDRFFITKNSPNLKNKCDIIIKSLELQDYVELKKVANFANHWKNHGLSYDELKTLPWFYHGEKQLSWYLGNFIGSIFLGRYAIFMSAFETANNG